MEISLEHMCTSTYTLSVVCCFVVGICVLKMLSALWDYWVTLSADPSCPYPLPPGHSGFPIVGETLSLVWNMSIGGDFYDKKRANHGPIYRTHLFGSPVIRVTSSEDVNTILRSEGTLVTNSSPATIRKLLGGNTLITAEGESHRTRRKSILKAFHRKPLEGYLPRMQRICENALSHWCKLQNIVVLHQAKRLAFQAALEILIGGHYGESNDVTEQLFLDFELFLKGFWTVPFNIPGTTFSKALMAKERIKRYIRRKMREIKNTESNTSTALQLLSESSSEVSEEDSILELLFAGHETLTSTITSTVMMLGLNPHVSERIKLELEQHGLLQPTTNLTYSQLQHLDYTQRVCKEIQYRFPPAGGVFKTAKRTFDILGHQIPRGWTVIGAIKDSHDTSELSSSAPYFNPDRWITRRPEAHFLTFGNGARSCVGREYAKLLQAVFTVSLVRDCQWTLKNESPKMQRLPSLRPSDGLPIHITSSDGSSDSHS